MPKSLRSVGIAGVGSAAPEKVLTNKDLEKIIDTSDEWIVSRTGISERRIASPEFATSDLATIAAKRALESAGVAAEDIDLVIVCTVSPDHVFPSTASIVQNRIGASKAGAFDLEAGCSGFIYGMTVGAQFIASGLYDHVLVIGAETLSRILNWDDRTTCVLFGDAAGAVVLRPEEEGRGLLAFTLGSDGSGADLLKVPAGGSRTPASLESVNQKLHGIQMAGAEVYKFAVRIMGEAAEQVLQQAGLTHDDVDCLIPHQANIRIIDAAAKRLDLPREKVFVNVQHYGNTSAASIPMALDEAIREGKVKRGDVVVMVGFGAGLTWAAAAMRY